ncbi:hypothetical protein LPJ68_005301 [Coemansia sp. RSA 1086]|nr:hypothetical protein LPJ68_005301 [Coemansia sp. RSA 1086]
MKRLLHRSSKKSDENQPPASPRRPWSGAGGLGAQLSRERSGSHPQIRHLAMEGHAGPVTRATMDEIRRDAAASSSNLRINSLALAPTPSASASVPPQAAGLREAPAAPASEFPPRTSSAAFAGPPLAVNTSRQLLDPPKPHTPGSSHDSDASFSASASAPGSSGFDAAPRPPAPRPPERPDSPSASEAGRRVISDKIKHLASRFSNPNLKDQPAPPPQAVRRRPSNSPSVSERVSLFDGHDHPRPADPRSEIFGRFGMASAQSGRSRASSASGIDSLPPSSAPHTPTQQRRPLSMALPDASASKCDSEKPRVPDSDSDSYLSAARDCEDRQSTISAGVQLNLPSSGSYRGVRNSSSSRHHHHHRVSIRSSLGSTADMLRINTSPADSSAPDLPPPSPHAHTSADAGSSYTSSIATSPSGTHSRFRRAGSVLAQPGSPTADIQRSSSTASHALGVHSRSRNRSLSATNSPVPSAASIDLALRDGKGANNAATDSENHMLWSCLAPRLHISGDNADIDSVLATAVNSDLSANSFEQPLQGAEAAAQLVDTVVATLETDKVLPSLEYDKYLLEAALLKPRVQSLRVQLSAQIRKRDEAKSLVDGHKPSSLGMFKGKSAQQALDYSDASAAVAETEVKLSELSTKLHYIESALRDHQVGVLLSALKTAVAESAYLQRSSRTRITALESRVERLDSEVTSAQSAHAAKLEALTAKHAAERTALDEEIRSLKNKHHDAVARQVSRSAKHADVDASLAQHSANLAVERLNGELTVLKEQKRDAEQQIRILESRLDAALLEAQDARNSLESTRVQAEAKAQESAARLDSSQNKIDSQQKCLQAMGTGLKSVVASLRTLDDVHASSEKLRALNSDPAVLASTPPATPTLSAADGSAHSAASIEACEVLLGEEGPNSDGRVAWRPEQITSALSLLTLTLDECSKLHSQAMKMHDAHVQLRKDLGAEQRLREAQGLAISQQREKLARANYLAESADQRVKEATDVLVAKHAEERARWNEETQRLLDNTERLKQDLKELQAANATMAPMQAVASAESAPEQSTVGSIEPVEATAAIADMSVQVKDLEFRLEECQSEVQAVRAQLQASVSENSRLEAQVLQLQNVEANLHLQLSELKTVKVSHDGLVRELEAAKAKSQANALKHSTNDLLLGCYMRKYKDNNSVPSSADVTAVEDSAQALNAKHDASSMTSSRLTRRWSLIDLHQAADLQTNGRIRHSLNLDVATATEFASTDVQTMTDTRPSASLDDENMAQMLAAYSEKLMLKEDSLRSREEDLEAVQVAAEEIEKALNKIVQSGTTAPTHNSLHALPRASLASVSSAAGNGSWSNGISAKTKPTLRNRSASFFHGLRSSSYRISGGSSPDIPAALFPARSESLSRSNSPLPQHADRPSSASADHVAVLARSESQITGSTRTTTSRSRSDVNNVPAFVRSLVPLVQMAVSEAGRLRNLIGDLESQSQEAHVELIDTRKKLAQLQNHCRVRERQEDAVQQDIAHVLGQISRLREHVVRLEREKSNFEDEAQALRKRCREIEDRTSEQVLQLIVNRVGKREWEKQRAAKADLNAVAEASVATPASSPDTDPKLPARFASISAVEVSHPEASDIRSEFNELLHQIISRRDEDIDRIQALADAWRTDARKASHASELRAWNTSSRGTQTA